MGVGIGGHDDASRFWLSRRAEPQTSSLLAAPCLVLAMLIGASCGGSGSSSSQNTLGTQGTPAGTYTATVAATSGALTTRSAFQMTVQ